MKHPRTHRSPRRLLPGFSLLLALTLLLALLSGCMSDDLQALADAVGDTAAMMEQLSGEAAPEETPEASPDAPATSPADAAQDTPEVTPQDTPEVPSEDGTPVEGEACFSTEEVALYLRLYRQLPPNFMTKDEARDLGWSGGDLWSYAPDRAIGGDRFGNREGLLPEGSWHECDVNYAGGSRGAERLVWNDDGDIYYTGDHYESFTQLYGGWAS